MPDPERAARSVVRDHRGHILLTRPDPDVAWRLPGGAAAAWESFRGAAVRATFEQTGLLVQLGREAGPARTASPAQPDSIERTYHATVLSVNTTLTTQVCWWDPRAEPTSTLQDGLIEYLICTGAIRSTWATPPEPTPTT